MSRARSVPVLLAPVLFVVTLLVGHAVGVARADDTATAFTPQQRDAIVAIVRQAMVRDPSILADAINALRAADQRSQATAQASAIVSHRTALLDPTGDAVAGNRQGTVTLVEFYDPRCPYCRRMVPTIAATIADDPQLRIVYKVIPILGAPSTLAARAIVAAGLHGRYVAMQERLMADDAPPDDASVAAAATSLGLDPRMLASEMRSDAVTKRLQSNLALAHALGIDGTPAFVVGDTLIPGAMTRDELRQAINSAKG